MIRIAIVGEIGSGKTHISKIFNLPTFNADNEVSKIYNNNKKIYFKLKKIIPDFIKSYPIKKKEIVRVSFLFLLSLPMMKYGLKSLKF